MFTHYGPATMDGVNLNRFGEWAAQKANELSAPHQTPILCYSGMSGISLATATMMHLAKIRECGGFYVRKPNEDSHGTPVEYSGILRSWRQTQSLSFFFVDDFICRGKTFQRVVEGLVGDGFLTHQSAGLIRKLLTRVADEEYDPSYGFTNEGGSFRYP